MSQPLQLGADFLDEYARRFLYAVLDGWQVQRSGGAHPGVDLGQTLLPWSQWCEVHGQRLDQLVDPFSDAEIKAVFDEITAFLAFLLLRVALQRRLPRPAVEQLAQSVPATTPFGPLSVKEPLQAYDSSSNPIQLFSHRTAALLPQAPELEGYLRMVGTSMGQVVEAVIDGLVAPPPPGS